MDRTKPPARAIRSFHQDAEAHWFARLECGHNQHTRHDPPWIDRPWVEHSLGRIAMLGSTLPCRKCAERAARDSLPHPAP
ncbi:MAG: DUF3565 domain-containing protein [Halothiobacillaceae bacterium]|nr:DUF3565 domain-containing protein [Halothiobacillaceae bacterium]HER34062.1 DUF3565 domain-containing protein [Halothiobacillaceae bacterium]